MDKGLFAHWRGDVLGGLTVALTSLPFAASCGSLAFGPLGPDYLSLGLLAAMWGTILTSIIAALFGSCPVQITGARASLAAVTATLLAAVGGTAGPVVALVLLALTGVLAGVFQILLGVLKVGRVIAFIPYPVVSGFMNGVALLLLLNQAGPALGLPAGTPPGVLMAQLADWRPLALAASATTVIVMMIGPRLTNRVPAALLGMMAGVAVHLVLHALLPEQPVSPEIGTIPMMPPQPDMIARIADIFAGPQIQGWLLLVLPFALSLALTGSIETMMNAAVADANLGTLTNANRELFGQGMANTTAAACGSLVGAAAPIRTMTNYRAGGRTPLAGVCHGLWLLLFLVVLHPLIAHLPLAAMAGVMISVAFSMMDGWSQGLLRMALTRHDGHPPWVAWANLGVVALVTAMTVLVGLAEAILAGFAVASAMFIARMIRQPVHQSFRCGTARSKKVWAAEDLALLHTVGDRIIVHRVQGPIFYGTVGPLARLLRQDLDTIDIVILDVRRVSALDATGVRLLQQVHRSLRAAGKHFVLSGVTPDHPAWAELDELGATGPGPAGLRLFDDMDSALEWAERTQLAAWSRRSAGAERELEELSYFTGLTAEQMAALRPLLRRRLFPAGSLIYAEGEPDTGMMFLVAGSVSVLLPIPGTGRERRLAGLGAGMVVGEMAILAGRPRTANVRVDDDVVCYELLKPDYERLACMHPEIAIALLRNLAADLTVRLAATSHELAAEDA